MKWFFINTACAMFFGSVCMILFYVTAFKTKDFEHRHTDPKVAAKPENQVEQGHWRVLANHLDNRDKEKARDIWKKCHPESEQQYVRRISNKQVNFSFADQDKLGANDSMSQLKKE